MMRRFKVGLFCKVENLFHITSHMISNLDVATGVPQKCYSHFIGNIRK